MKKIYRILSAPDAPLLEILENQPYAHLFTEFLGESLIGALPDELLVGRLSNHREWNQFYRIAPGGLAVSEEAWEKCMNMYYVITGMNNIELVSIRTVEANMRVIIPRDVLPATADASLPCDLKYASSLFRIAGRPKTELFCLEGTEVPGDEFKYVYDKFGFEGLIFEEIWRGEYTRVK